MISLTLCVERHLIGDHRGDVLRGPAECRYANGVLDRDLLRRFFGGQFGISDVEYDWVERFKTPSVLSIRLEPATFQGAYAWINRSFVDKLGLQRIGPEPALSIPQAQGIGYLFAVQQSGQPITLDFALEPAQVGFFRQEVRVAGGQQLFCSYPRLSLTDN